MRVPKSLKYNTKYRFQSERSLICANKKKMKNTVDEEQKRNRKIKCMCWSLSNSLNNPLYATNTYLLPISFFFPFIFQFIFYFHRIWFLVDIFYVPFCQPLRWTHRIRFFSYFYFYILYNIFLVSQFKVQFLI